MRRVFTNPLVGIAVVALALGGCATNKAVDKKIADAQSQTDKKVESVEGQIEEIQEKNRKQDELIEKYGQTAADALKRAQEAGVLAEGKVVFEQTFKEDRIRFKTGSSDLSKASEKALDEFAAKVKEVGKGVYLEIQGHTDDVGSKKYNDALGESRAESVRRYLSRQHQLPLVRMSTISYGDTVPVASNKSRKGRTENRRVVIVVLQ
ncbi:MAG TPA: OmpA family protein [Thermoanaerobaculia bacterium]|nr:OmpA family protein [Thermoanaerobaculia bacterium]